MPEPSDPSPGNLPDHFVLMGLMGVGKSTVGRVLASRLGWPLDDSDESIARRCGATVRELNERLGTEGMHRLETEHLMSGLAEAQPSVICAAASVIDHPECRSALRRDGVYAVWLKGRRDTLVHRFATGPHRPILGVDIDEVFQAQLGQRARRFASVARHSVEVEGRTPEDIAEEILQAVTSGGSPVGPPS